MCVTRSQCESACVLFLLCVPGRVYEEIESKASPVTIVSWVCVSVPFLIQALLDCLQTIAMQTQSWHTLALNLSGNLAVGLLWSLQPPVRPLVSVPVATAGGDSGRDAGIELPLLATVVRVTAGGQPPSQVQAGGTYATGSGEVMIVFWQPIIVFPGTASARPGAPVPVPA